MKIATWNVNSIKARLDNAVTWLKEAKPDVLCLQELKCEKSAFPASAFEDLGYSCLLLGQKTYNGVALISRSMPNDVLRGLPGDDSDQQARYIEAVYSHHGGVVRIASLYLPNGNPVGSEKYAYKLAWMDRLIEHSRGLLKNEEPLVLAGDYNAIPTPRDAKHPDAWRDDALFQPESRARFRKLINLGLVDAVRQRHGDADGLYTFWDYQALAWQRNNGIRIDHVLLSPQAADMLADAQISRDVRAQERPSDHVPVVITLK
jgi:exodeoxyribonuclease-3